MAPHPKAVSESPQGEAASPTRSLDQRPWRTLPVFTSSPVVSSLPWASHSGEGNVGTQPVERPHQGAQELSLTPHARPHHFFTAPLWTEGRTLRKRGVRKERYPFLSLEPYFSPASCSGGRH